MVSDLGIFVATEAYTQQISYQVPAEYPLYEVCIYIYYALPCIPFRSL